MKTRTSTTTTSRVVHENGQRRLLRSPGGAHLALLAAVLLLSCGGDSGQNTPTTGGDIKGPAKSPPQECSDSPPVSSHFLPACLHVPGPGGDCEYVRYNAQPAPHLRGAGGGEFTDWRHKCETSSCGSSSRIAAVLDVHCDATALDFSPDGNYLAIRSGYALLWDLRENNIKELTTDDFVPGAPMAEEHRWVLTASHTVRFAESGALLAIASAPNRKKVVRVLDPLTAKTKHTYRGAGPATFGNSDTMLAHDSGFDSIIIRKLSAPDAFIFDEIEGATAPWLPASGTALAYRPAGMSGTIRVIDRSTGDSLLEVAHEGEYALGSGGSRLFTTRGIWRTGGPPTKLTSYEGDPALLSVAEAAHSVATGSFATARIINYEADATAEYACHCGPLTAVALSRDGRFLATAGIDHTIKIWRSRSSN